MWGSVFVGIIFFILHVSPCNPSPINGFYYSPSPIGVDGGSSGINVYDDYFTQLHTRDMQVLSGMVNTIRISSLGTSSKNHGFLDNANKHNISVMAGFGLASYVFNSPKQLQKQLTKLRTDFKKFITTHKEHPAISVWCIGDVDDFVFSVGTSLQQYLINFIFYFIFFTVCITNQVT